jgi:hypothetical protein
MRTVIFLLVLLVLQKINVRGENAKYGGSMVRKSVQ